MEPVAHEPAITEFRAVLAVDPSDTDASANLARLLQAQGRYGEALACWETVKGDATLPGRVRCLVGLGREAEARALVRDRLARSPGDGAILLKALAGGPRGCLPRRLDLV